MSEPAIKLVSGGYRFGKSWLLEKFLKDRNNYLKGTWISFDNGDWEPLERLPSEEEC